MPYFATADVEPFKVPFPENAASLFENVEWVKILGSLACCACCQQFSPSNVYFFMRYGQYFKLSPREAAAVQCSVVSLV